MTMDSSAKREVRQTQIEPVAGIWACANCGRRIQVIQEGDKEKVQPFTCVCGAAMDPGEEHSPGVSRAEPAPSGSESKVIDA